MIKRSIAFIADTHVGGRYAIWPKHFKTSEGNELKQSRAQIILMEYWNYFLSKCNEFKVDTVMLPGDLIDGVNPKEKGSMLMCPELDVQMDACEEILAPLCHNRRSIFLTGTPYHESQDFKVHKALAKSLKGHFYGMIANIHIAGTKRLVNIAHGSTAAAYFRTTVMDREGIYSLAGQALGVLPKTDIIVRGHSHTFFHLHLPKQHLISLPCWQAFKPFPKIMSSYARMQPSVGGVIVTIDHEDRIAVYHFCMDKPPKIADFERRI